MKVESNKKSSDAITKTPLFQESQVRGIGGASCARVESNKNNEIIVYDAVPLDLEQTLDCGQCFRWTKNEDNSFTGIAFGKVITAKMNNTDLVLSGVSLEDYETIWEPYFDLNTDYNEIISQLSRSHPVLAKAAEYASGIRILRQEPFETLCTFIISQNNNIKRIKGIIRRLCENFGDAITTSQGEEAYFAFPSLEKMASLTEEDLQVIKAGFRSRYLIDCAQKLSKKQIDISICKNAPYEEAQSELMKILGIGKKVSDCILLFAFHRTESFPVDVWMKRALSTLFADLDPKILGSYAGIAQQYIFHYSRMHPESV